MNFVLQALSWADSHGLLTPAILAALTLLVRALWAAVRPALAARWPRATEAAEAVGGKFDPREKGGVQLPSFLPGSWLINKGLGMMPGVGGGAGDFGGSTGAGGSFDDGGKAAAGKPGQPGGGPDPQKAAAASAAATTQRALSDVMTSLKMSMGPKAAYSGLADVGQQMQLAALNVDPLEARVRERTLAAIDMLMASVPKIADNTNSKPDTHGRN